MQIKEVTDQAVWTNRLNDFGAPSFLQSWEWGEVQKHHGYQVRRLGVYEEGKLIAIAQTVLIRAKRGNMIFVPHGPMTMPDATDTLKSQMLMAVRDHLAALAHQDGYHFIRIAPIWEDTGTGRSLFAGLGFRTSPIYMHAERVWILDIRKSEDELLRDMRKTTRYSIRKAEKEGVVIKHEDNLERFWAIYKETAERENFTPFSKAFIKAEYEEFRKTGCELFVSGLLDGGASCAASALITFTSTTAFYHQGATTHSRVPVSYLLQWRAICEAKKRGCSFYNFWGILQPGRTPKNWGGLSLFKQGFGGFQRDYIPTQDYIVDPLRYAISYAFETYLKFKRGV